MSDIITIYIIYITYTRVTCFWIILDADFGASRWLMEEADAQVAAIKAAEAAENADFEKKRRRRKLRRRRHAGDRDEFEMGFTIETGYIWVYLGIHHDLSTFHRITWGYHHFQLNHLSPARKWVEGWDIVSSAKLKAFEMIVKTRIARLCRTCQSWCVYSFSFLKGFKSHVQSLGIYSFAAMTRKHKFHVFLPGQEKKSQQKRGFTYKP